MHQAMLSGARTTSRCSVRCGSSWMRRWPPVTRPWTMSKSKLSMALRSAESSCVCIGLGASARGGERDGVAGGTGVGEGWFAGGDVRGGVVGGSDVGEGWLAGGLAGAVIARGGGCSQGVQRGGGRRCLWGSWREACPWGGRRVYSCCPSSWAFGNQPCPGVRRRELCHEWPWL